MKLQGYLGTFMFTDNTSTHLYGAIQYYDEKHIRFIFNNTTKIITEHPELLTYFDIRSQGKYGTSNLRHDLNKYSLTELLSVANKHNNYAN